MDATDILCKISEAFYHAELDAVMIGNAAAALQGAPVTTLDIDFAIKEDDSTLMRLNKVADELDANFVNYAPFFQIQAPEQDLYLDFLCNVIGVDSFDSLFQNSTKVSFDGIYHLHIASIEDIIKSKRCAGQPKDLAVLPILEKTLKLKNEKE